MNICWLLLATSPKDAAYVNTIDAIRNAFTAGPNRTDTTVLLLVVGGLIVATTVAFALSRRRERSVAPDTPDYLTTVVDLLNLSEQERRDLRAVVQGAAPSSPPSILLSPQNLASAIARCESPGLAGETIVRLNALCQRLFEQPLPQVVPSSGGEARPTSDSQGSAAAVRR